MKNLSNNFLKHNWLVNKISDAALANAIEKYAHGILLDVGCGEKPYSHLTKSYVDQHIGLDHESTMHEKSNINLFGTAYDIPVEDRYFDTILCTAVLEHLENPDRAINEASRVLKNGGYAIYTVPLFWHLHEEPRDFFRYTKFGLKYLFEKNGFKIIEIKPLSGFIVTFGQEFIYFLWRFRLGGKFNPLWWIIPPICCIIQIVCYLLNKIDHSYEFSWMYLVTAKKE